MKYTSNTSTATKPLLKLLARNVMRFLSNTFNPKHPNARQYLARSIGEDEEQAWQHYQDWLRGKIIDDPQASKKYTVEELKAMGYVGVYAPD